MTQTQHTTRSCRSSSGSSSSDSSSNHLKHAQPQRCRQMSTLLLLLLISCSAAATAAATAQSRFFYSAAESQGKTRLQRQTNDADVAADVEAAEATSCCQGAAAAAVEPVTVSLDQGNVTTDYGSGETSSKENVKRSVTRATVRNATPASCSPQPTIVELKPLTEQTGEQLAGNVYYSPACTRINRCNGCCGSTLISCQPTQTELLQLRVRKVERFGASSKRGSVIISVEQHLACKCDCRIKAEDCNANQEYRKDLCRCECQNTDSRDKCLEQSDHKYWDDANCTCACRYNQSCTTGTVFDETQCKCTDPSTPSDLADRRRFIVQAVAVEPDNSTLYSV